MYPLWAMRLGHFQKRCLNKNASMVSKPETEAHALSLQVVFSGNTKEAVKHVAAIGAKCD